MKNILLGILSVVAPVAAVPSAHYIYQRTKPAPQVAPQATPRDACVRDCRAALANGEFEKAKQTLLAFARHATPADLQYVWETVPGVRDLFGTEERGGPLADYRPAGQTSPSGWTAHDLGAPAASDPPAVQAGGQRPSLQYLPAAVFRHVRPPVEHWERHEHQEHQEHQEHHEHVHPVAAAVHAGKR